MLRDGANWRSQDDKVRGGASALERFALVQRELLVGESAHLRCRDDGREIHRADVLDSAARAQRAGKRSTQQTKANDDDASHRRTAAPTARSFSARSTACAQRSVAGTRMGSPSRPTQTRKITPSAPDPTAAQATAAE